MIGDMDDRGEPGPLPKGVVTFLLTDVAGSTQWWTTGGPEAGQAMARQGEIIGAAVAAHGGARPLEQGEGDSVVAVFERASDALAAALEAQLALAAGPWAGPPVGVRMAVHTGEAEFRDDQAYGGEAIIRCARLRDHAQGGQVLVSAATAEVAADRLPPGAALVPVGEATLRGLARTERAHQLVHEALAAPVAQLGAVADRLGSWPTRLVGRATERAEVGALLDEARLVTLAGTGGTGKTRLAHAVAVDLTWRFSDVVWVELARVTDEADVATAVAHACGALQAQGVEAVEVLAGFLGAREILVVLDNCEHLLGACAALADRVLRAAPEVRLLATSREPFGVAGEVIWRVPSLEVPPPAAGGAAGVGGYDAVQLFVERGRAALPAFVLDDSNANEVAAICRRLDGLPLAIELAAARLRSMTLTALGAGLDDRFRLLTGGSRTALPRQQALAASVDWSYGLCDEHEQQLLRRLAVFLAPFSLEAAEAVAADGGADRLAVFDVLSRLVDKSLVQPTGDRYRLLETIRQFALDRAAQHEELDGLRDAHLRWFTHRADRWALDREILTERTLRDISLESPDLVGALEWSLRPGAEPATVLLWPLGRHWLAESGFAETSRAAGLLRERFEAGSPGWFEALAALADPLTMAGDMDWIEEGKTMVGATAGSEDDQGSCWPWHFDPAVARVLAGAHVSSVVGPLPALAIDAEPIDVQRRAHLEWSARGAPHQPGSGRIFTDPYSLPWLESFVELGRREGNRAVEHGAAASLAYACSSSGAVADADRWCDWLDRRIPGDAWLRNVLATARGYTALMRCQFEAAWGCVNDRAQRRPPHLPCAGLAGLVGIYTTDRELIEVGLRAFEATHFSGAYGSWSFVLRAVEALLDGRLAEARAILEPVEGPVFALNQSPLNERLRVHLALATGDLAGAQERGERLRPLLDPSTSLLYATMPYPSASVHLAQADVAAASGDLRAAEESVHAALRIVGAELPLLTVDALELLAVLLAQRNRAGDAARLLGAVEAARAATGYSFRLPYRALQIQAQRGALDPADLAAGARLTLAEAVALATGARGKRGRPSFGWESLTPTEARVVELVGEGCSNAQIAEKLFVGVSTVKTHLVHVYEKLGMSSRTELAAAAGRKEATS